MKAKETALSMYVIATFVVWPRVQAAQGYPTALVYDIKDGIPYSKEMGLSRTVCFVSNTYSRLGCICICSCNRNSIVSLSISFFFGAFFSTFFHPHISTHARAHTHKHTTLKALYLIKFTFIVLGADMWTYWKHRSLHSRILWVFHKSHHAYHDPTCFAGFALHPVEGLLT